jgi:hypothetical protein
MKNITKQLAEQLLEALAEQLAAEDRRHELVVIGGSGLLALEIVDRPTSDVDVLAVQVGGKLVKPDPLPPELVKAAGRVGRDFGLTGDWLNAGPASLLDLGLPRHFEDRLQTRRFGESLTVHFASRYDQIHFKLYAVVDERSPGRHEADLRALRPSQAELVAAARWTRTHDPSPGHRSSLEQVLRHFGVEDADLGD